MSRRIILSLIIGLLLVGFGTVIILAVLGSRKVFSPDETKIAETSEQVSVEPSIDTERVYESGPPIGVPTYIDYDYYQNDYRKRLGDFGEDYKVILFFHAGWCSICQALDKDIEANLSEFKSNTVIVKVDYDTQNDLRVRYGVRQQYTLVQIDNQGDEIKKWLGSTRYTSITSNIQ